MDKAIEFAWEILRKENAISQTKSSTLKCDYDKSIRADKRDLRFYCKSMGLNYDDVMCEARKKAV